MCEVLVRFFDAITGISWYEFIKTLATATTAIVAGMALRNWKRQDKAKREATFLDELIEAVQTYSHSLSPLFAHVMVMRIAIYGPDGPRDEVIDAEAIREFIKADRGTTFINIEEELDPVRSAALRLDAIVKKGTIFRFQNYEKCQAAIDEMRNLLNLVEVLAATLGSTYRDHNDPQAQAAYGSFAKIIKLDLRDKNKAGNEKFLMFVTGAFEQIYG